MIRVGCQPGDAVIEIVFELPGGPLAPHLARGRLPHDMPPHPRVAMLELLLSELVEERENGRP